MHVTMAERIKLKDDVRETAKRYGLPINSKIRYELVVRIVRIERELESIKAALRPLNSKLHHLIKQKDHLLDEAGIRRR